MITEIGIVAGQIWKILEDKKSVSLTGLVDMVKESREVVLMSLGWLAREGHVTLESFDQGLIITLISKNG